MFCLLSPSPFSERLRLVSRTGNLTMYLWEFNLFLPDSPSDAAGYRARSATSEPPTAVLKWHPPSVSLAQPRDLRIIPRQRKSPGATWKVSQYHWWEWIKMACFWNDSLTFRYISDAACVFPLDYTTSDEMWKPQVSDKASCDNT